MISAFYLDYFRDLIQKQIGIFYPKKKDYLLDMKLNRVLKKNNLDSIEELFKKIKNNEKKYIDDLACYITTNHTFFFRESAHFDYLVEDIKKRGIIKPLIWCGASSTGEEVYSIAIKLFLSGITDYLIIASDIDRDVLYAVKRGVYAKKQLEKTDEKIIKRCFKIIDENKELYQIKDFLKRNILVKKLNLIDELLFEKKFDYIFCRNVMIYFNNIQRRKVVMHLLNNLDNNGLLFVGHSESLLKMTDLVKSMSMSVYKKVV